MFVEEFLVLVAPAFPLLLSAAKIPFAYMSLKARRSIYGFDYLQE